LFTEQCQTSLNKKRYTWHIPLTWPNRSERSVKLLNETQNIWASDLSNRKILITLEWGPFSLDIWET
jgi:hypothetical protein